MMAATQAGTGSDAGDRLLPAVISVSSLTKRYEDVEAVRGIDFEVVRGETFGFLGPNGAGKTTTIKILCTLASATSGSAKVAGHDTRTEQDEVRRNIGLVFQDGAIFPHLDVAANVAFGLPRAERTGPRVAEARSAFLSRPSAGLTLVFFSSAVRLGLSLA